MTSSKWQPSDGLDFNVLTCPFVTSGLTSYAYYGHTSNWLMLDIYLSTLEVTSNKLCIAQIDAVVPKIWYPQGCISKKYRNNGDIMAWNHFPHYWPFVRGIHQSPVASPYKGPVMRTFGVSFVAGFNKLLSKQKSCQWYELPWCHCNANWSSNTQHLAVSFFFFEKIFRTKKVQANSDYHNDRWHYSLSRFFPTPTCYVPVKPGMWEH